MPAVSPLLQALYEGRAADVDARLAEQPQLDVFEAAALGRSERLEELLAAEPSLAGAWSVDGFTPLHLAAFFGRLVSARLLVERGAPVDVPARNDMRVTPLHSAAAAGEKEIAELLLERGADPNARQQGGFTPIHAAAQNGDAELAALLVRHGAEPSLATDDGRTAFELAREAGHAELARRLGQ
jgi:ankyrin repeat protein